MVRKRNLRWCLQWIRFKWKCSWEYRRSNLFHLRHLPHYEFAVAILNLGEDPCSFGPRLVEERCNEDCDNCIVEWLNQPYDPNSKVWRDNW